MLLWHSPQQVWKDLVHISVLQLDNIATQFVYVTLNFQTQNMHSLVSTSMMVTQLTSQMVP